MNNFVPAPIKPIITIADLDKLDIRVGMVEMSNSSRVLTSS
jgi:hypothetical protein